MKSHPPAYSPFGLSASVCGYKSNTNIKNMLKNDDVRCMVNNGEQAASRYMLLADSLKRLMWQRSKKPCIKQNKRRNTTFGY